MEQATMFSMREKPPQLASPRRRTSVDLFILGESLSSPCAVWVLRQFMLVMGRAELAIGKIHLPETQRGIFLPVGGFYFFHSRGLSPVEGRLGASTGA